MIVYCCSDLFFASKIGGTADAMDVPARPARSVDKLNDRLHRVDDGKANDPVGLVLIDIDLGDMAVELIKAARAHSDELNVIAFGSHVAAAQLRAARDAGASEVMPRSHFVQLLPSLVQAEKRRGKARDAE